VSIVLTLVFHLVEFLDAEYLVLKYVAEGAVEKNEASETHDEDQQAELAEFDDVTQVVQLLGLVIRYLLLVDDQQVAEVHGDQQELEGAHHRVVEDKAQLPVAARLERTHYE